MGSIKLDVLYAMTTKNMGTMRMSPERHELMILIRNRHTGDGSAAGSDVRSRVGVCLRL